MILIGTDNGIYRWFDGCGWPIFHSLQNHATVSLAAPGAGVLAALDREGRLFESVDNGQDWREIPLAEGAGQPSAIAVWGTPATLLLASRPGGLYQRAVGAPIPRADEEPPADLPGSVQSWTRRARLLAEGATALLPARRKQPRVDRETARRAGWTRLAAISGSGVSPATFEVRALTMGTGESAPWFAAVPGAGLWRSRDAGTSWERCPGLPAEVYAIRTSPKRPGMVAVGTSDGCWLSADGGETWEDRSSGLERGRFVSALEFKPDAPDTMLAGAGPFAPEHAGLEPKEGAGYSLFESSNGGKSWSHVKRGHPELLEDDAIVDIRYDPAAPHNIIVAFASGELWVTRNEGAYWGPLARQIEKARVLRGVS